MREWLTYQEKWQRCRQATESYDQLPLLKLLFELGIIANAWSIWLRVDVDVQRTLRVTAGEGFLSGGSKPKLIGHTAAAPRIEGVSLLCMHKGKCGE